MPQPPTTQLKRTIGIFVLPASGSNIYHPKKCHYPLCIVGLSIVGNGRDEAVAEELLYLLKK